MSVVKPTIGRIVHYVERCVTSDEHLAAIVTHVWSDSCVNLFVFVKATRHDGDGLSKSEGLVKTSVNFKQEPEPNSWHWPEVAA